MNLQAILAKDPSTLSSEERKFLQKHASELSSDQRMKFNISDEDSDEDDDEDLDEDDDEDPDEDDDDSDGDDDDDPDESDVDPADDDDAATLRKKLKTAVSQKEHHRKKREEAESALQASRGESGKKKKKKSSSSVDDRYARERTDFRFDHPYLKSSIVDQVETYARAKNVSMRVAAKDDLVRLLIKKAKKRSALNVSSIDTGHRSAPHKGNRKDWGGASKEDLETEAQRRRELASQE
ncbi:MAG: hypothetical protein WC477_07570 [Patescibacteria group bacterium]